MTSESKWIKCISAQGNIRGVVVQATPLIQEMARRHKTEGELACRLGETVMGALLIASYCKGGERINLNIQGSGSVKQALVDAHPDGTVRGYVVGNSGPTRKGAGAFAQSSESGPWGDGFLSVLRTQGTENEKPYIGTVPLLTGHLAKDLTFYWVQSEQIPSAVGLSVQLGNDGEVAAANGFLVQILPGASPEEVKSIERHINEMGTGELIEHRDPKQLMAQIFQSTAFLIVEEKPLLFKCTCSWDRVRKALLLVGPRELRAMLAEDHAASIHCDFCTTEYKVDAAGLEKLIAEAEGSSLKT